MCWVVWATEVRRAWDTTIPLSAGTLVMQRRYQWYGLLSRTAWTAGQEVKFSLSHAFITGVCRGSSPTLYWRTGYCSDDVNAV